MRGMVLLDAFAGAPHLLAPTGTGLAAHGALGTVLAGCVGAEGGGRGQRGGSGGGAPVWAPGRPGCLHLDVRVR